MSIVKYLKDTPDYTIPNTAWASIDNQNLKLYKLSNAGDDNIGIEWCYSTNFNNVDFNSNTYSNVYDMYGGDTGYKTGIKASAILPLDNGRNILQIDDTQAKWEKILGGLAYGLVYFNGDLNNAYYNNIYICSNVDYSRIALRTSGWDSTTNTTRKMSDGDDKSLTDGMGLRVMCYNPNTDTFEQLPDFSLAYATISSDNIATLRIYPNNHNKFEAQVGVKDSSQTDSVYVNREWELPWRSDGSLGITEMFQLKHKDQLREIFTIPQTKQAMVHNIFLYRTYYAGTYCFTSDVKHWITFLNSTGLRYYDGNEASTTEGIKTNIYMGIMDKQGITDSENRIKGWDEIESSDLPNKNRNGYDWDVVNPTKPPVEPDTDDIETVGYGYFSNTTMGTLYALKNKLDLEKITQWLLTQTEKIDIANNVVSLKEIPFPLSTLGIQPLDTNLKIGGTNVTYQGNNVVVGEIVGPTIPTLSVVFADFDIPRLSGTFLDYAPYTKYELLVPFAPSPISLPDWCINKNVKAIFLYDIYTMGCQYVIECNGERICSVSGNFGIDRPVSAQNVAIKDATRLSSQIATASSVLGGVMSGATGNVGGIISGAIGGVSALSQMILSGKQNYMYTVGANGDSSTVGLYHAAHLKITRTLSAEDENFVHIYGKPLCQVRKLSTLSGYTKCDNVNTSGLTCSESEKQMIKNLLESGVHI